MTAGMIAGPSGSRTAWMEDTDQNGAPCRKQIVAIDPKGTNPVAPDNVVDGQVTGATFTAVNQTLVLPNAGFTGGTIEVESGMTGGAVLTVQQMAVGGTTWSNIAAIQETVSYASASSAIVSAGIYRFYCLSGQIRVIVSAYGGTPIPVNVTQKRVGFATNIGLLPGTQLIGDVHLATTAANTNPGLTPGRVTTGASGVIKAAAGRMYGYGLLNVQASARYLQVYNKATAGIPGTDTPLVTIPFGANGGASLPTDIGTYAATGLSWAITTDAAGAVAGTSGDIVGTIYYA